MDFVLITSNRFIKERVLSIGQDFQYSIKSWDNLDEIIELKSIPTATFVLVSCSDDGQKDSPGNIIQVTKQLFPSSFVCAIGSDNLSNEDAVYAKKCGADAVLIKTEIFETSKLEYIASQIIKASFLPVKSNEIITGSVINFDLFHLLPQHQRFLHCGWEGDVVSENKAEKYRTVGELYIRRNDARKFQKYIEENNDLSANGLAKRCRAQFMSLYANYNDLVLMLIDKSEHGSFQKGSELMTQCQELCEGLIMSLASLGDAYEVINTSTIGEFGSAERSPAIASYAALFALSSEIEGIVDIMVAAMLADIGLITLHPKITKKIRDEKIDELTKDEREDYENHPLKSLYILADRKIPISFDIRKIIGFTHVYENGTGFPKKFKGRTVPVGSQLIQISEEVDKKTILRLGKARPKHKEEMQKVIESAIKKQTQSPRLLKKIS